MNNQKIELEKFYYDETGHVHFAFATESIKETGCYHQPSERRIEDLEKADEQLMNILMLNITDIFKRHNLFNFAENIEVFSVFKDSYCLVTPAICLIPLNNPPSRMIERLKKLYPGNTASRIIKCLKYFCENK